MGKEYLVEGAMLMCVNGSSFNMLKIPIGHGYTSAGKKKANCRDCKACMNISYFGACRKNEKTHLCEGYMLLADKWESTEGTAGAAEKVAGEEALTMDSVLLCKKGGVIMPLTSGQGYEKGIDWGAFMKRFQKVVGWVAGKNLMCQVFGGDPINMNTGNFIYEREDLKIPGITQLSFHLFYNSLEQDRNGCLGEGWHHNYEIHIREEEAGSLLYVCLGDGRELPYRPAIGDLYAPLLGDRGLLKKEGELSAYHTPEGSVYTYDRRGNLTGEYQEGKLLHGYEFCALNRLERAWDNTGKEAEYFYNGLGQRTGRRTNEKREDYLLDLTRAYHNLLGLETGEERQNFYWDFGVAAMEDKDRKPRYYLQDELGSPLRVLYGNGNGNIYGYDEFGEELYEAPDPEKEASNRYSRQGEGQPFGYTGYRYDAVGGTYFAQAREYLSKCGIFSAADEVRKNGVIPMMLNRYIYCLYNPLRYIDLNGKEEGECSVYYLNNMDGAKIFGHNAILVKDSDGTSEFYSFMGTGAMPDIFNPYYDSLGYMGHESLSKDETELFLQTGDVYVTMADNTTKNHDNYDRALKKDIDREEYDQINQAAQYYVTLFDM